MNRALLILHWIIAVVICMVLVYLLFIQVVSHGSRESVVFAGGLALIGIVLSLLAWPVSSHMTKPLERLEKSALRIAGGDLMARAEIPGKHEIGRQLGSAFNLMAEKVECMVRGGKELTANLSHELRSPLTRIRVAGECLKDALDKGDSEYAREMLKAMWEDIEEADRMIGRILEFSKVDLHEPLPAAGEAALAEIIEGVVKTLAPLSRSKQIDIGLDLAAGGRVAGDEEWLRTAFKNLLENALRYTDPGGAVHVMLSSCGGDVLVEVTNTFAPLEPEELEAIFKPFYRGQPSKSEGTGLGLAIVKKIIAMHHGEVGAKSVTEGFQIWVRLPAMTHL